MISVFFVVDTTHTLTRPQILLNLVSDDECPRYRFSFLLCSTSRLELFLLASSFAWYCMLLPFMCFFFDKRMLSLNPFFLSFSSLYVHVFFFGWESVSFCFSFLFEYIRYSAVSLCLCRQGWLTSKRALTSLISDWNWHLQRRGPNMIWICLFIQM